MKKLNFRIDIHAPREKVWDVLWNDATYREWTSAFSEGSYAESDWKEGSRIRFLSPEGSGMYSVIDRLIPNEFMSFRHLGEIVEGKELPNDEKSGQWNGAMENYTLIQTDHTTSLLVDIDMMAEHEEFFQKAFPKALEKVKEIAERN